MLARPLRLDIDNSYNVQKFDILCSGKKKRSTTPDACACLSLDRHINIHNSDIMLSVIDSVACFIVIILIIL